MRITESVSEYLAPAALPFKQIIFITNDRNPQTNKTLGNLTQAVLNRPLQLQTLLADELRLEILEGGSKLLRDSQTVLELKNASQYDALVILRLGATASPQCEQALKALKEFGFLTLNSLEAARRASNKYSTALTLSEAGVAQPPYTLISAYSAINSQTLAKACAQVYPDWGQDAAADAEREFVVKTLDGHGGAGVFLARGASLLSTLQAIFTIKPSVSLLLQQKLESDGDIRVHVLNLRGKQIVLGAMKRTKLEGDFRSNVSLGAATSPIQLTDVQRELALKAAAASGLVWCAVDIMPAAESDVVLELNASPGTEGISEALGVNFMDVLLDALTDPNAFPIEETTAGFRETIEINGVKLLAKLDTGNGAKYPTLSVGSLAVGENEATFSVNDEEMTAEIKEKVQIGEGNAYKSRCVVEFDEVKIGLRRLRNVRFYIDEDRKKSTDVLVNRDLIRRMGYAVSASRTHLLTSKG